MSNLPTKLNEVSGIETVLNSDLIWMINDGGNPASIYGVNKKGDIKKELKIKAKNNDWEDLTSDDKRNIYIGDFGNNNNDRKNLSVLKVNNDALNESKKIKVEKIQFKYPDQNEFPPHKDNWHFDCEAFFYYKDSLFLFTKSRTNKNFGQTSLYKIPAKSGKYIAQYIATFNTGNGMESWVTAADISEDGKMVTLLTPKFVWIFSNYKSTNFFNGTVAKLTLEENSQKEGICFKNNNTLYITDEKSHGFEGSLYSLKLQQPNQLLETKP
ncbi:hypothetical protein J8H85_06830 [Mariniflexile gromovii]|uniref:Uncharacterized protein n=1 Tax=Mariniflexile gromovii TaxID=362523 RepID=A0ABS4BU17_9FLAO|nr:hypothetical protein [Mariniflexile gromovii]